MRKWFWLLIGLMLLSACQPEDNISIDGPILVQEVTLAPVEIRATRFLSPTPTPDVASRPTSEVVSPLDRVTVDAQFVLVTPTLPPSKTPTPTPTQTETPTVTPTTTMTNTATATTFLLPTSEIIALTQPASSNADRICETNWFFIEPRPENCPLNPPTASGGVFQEFQFGTMIWVGSGDAIYILYNDENQPRWEVYRDSFDENNSSMAYLDAPPRELQPGYWSARRGFGLLWEQNVSVRNRIGYAIQQWEQPYSVQLQSDSNNTLFISTPRNFVFALFADRRNWERYYSYSFTPSSNPTFPPVAPAGTVIPPRLSGS